MSILINKKRIRMRRFIKVRAKIQQLKAIRLVIHRTARHMYAQIISNTYKVLTTASTLEKKIQKNLSYTGNKEAANLVGLTIARRALKKGINTVAFDRSGFKYHGRVKAVAESARKEGLNF